MDVANSFRARHEIGHYLRIMIIRIINIYYVPRPHPRLKDSDFGTSLSVSYKSEYISNPKRNNKIDILDKVGFGSAPL
jgi:hypothetical protein